MQTSRTGQICQLVPRTTNWYHIQIKHTLAIGLITATGLHCNVKPRVAAEHPPALVVAVYVWWICAVLGWYLLHRLGHEYGALVVAVLVHGHAVCMYICNVMLCM